VELDGTNVVKMTKQSEQTPSQFVVPDFDLVIISYKTKRNSESHNKNLQDYVKSQFVLKQKQQDQNLNRQMLSTFCIIVKENQ
jgi:hypothetical protein